MTVTRTYTCEGCGVTFTGTHEQAFNEGWDTPERFLSHCTCPACPIDRTLWWRVTLWQKDHPDEPFPVTLDELQLLHEYSEVRNEAEAAYRREQLSE